jgi:hypothetical protein
MKTNMRPRTAEEVSSTFNFNGRYTMRYASSILNGLKLAAAEGRLLSIGELFGRAWQLGEAARR